MKAPYDEVYDTCPICGGSGYVINDEGDECECSMCGGRGECERDDPTYKEWVREHYSDD